MAFFLPLLGGPAIPARPATVLLLTKLTCRGSTARHASVLLLLLAGLAPTTSSLERTLLGDKQAATADPNWRPSIRTKETVYRAQASRLYMFRS